MKKALIYTIIVLIILAGGGFYYFYFYEKPPEKAVISQVNTVNKTQPKTAVVKEETETVTAGEDSEIETGPVLVYRKTYRNPFKDYKSNVKNPKETIIKVDTEEDKGEGQGVQEEKEPELTVEMVKRLVPFQLTGLIGTDKVRLAIVEGSQGSVVISKGEEINGFVIHDILSTGIVVEYRGIKLTLEMGSDGR